MLTRQPGLMCQKAVLRLSGHCHFRGVPQSSLAGQGLDPFCEQPALAMRDLRMTLLHTRQTTDNLLTHE